jgi:G3E family GTPase
LGSGKTTLLNQILKNRQDLKVAILVNEFGDINIDSQLLITIDEDIVELTNGCICCTINDSLVDAIYRVLERREQIDYLVVETTGVADPLPIVLTFLGTELREFTYLDSILTLVDSETFTPEHFKSDAAFQQITYGDIILLNKIDLVSDIQLDQLEQNIHRFKEGARILRCEQGNVPLSLILDARVAELSPYSSLSIDDIPQPQTLPRHLQNDGFMSVSFQSDRPFDIKKFQELLDYHLPIEVFRAKGILWFSESLARHVFQLSGKRFQIQDSPWTTFPSNQLVCIGQKLNPIQIQQLLNDCLSKE